jgi:hypothetical protein
LRCGKRVFALDDATFPRIGIDGARVLRPRPPPLKRTVSTSRTSFNDGEYNFVMRNNFWRMKALIPSRATALAALGVCAGSANTLLLYKTFEPHGEVVAYYLALNATSLAIAVLIAPFEQFVHFYARALRTTPPLAAALLSASLVVASIAGAACAGLSLVVGDIGIRALSPHVNEATARVALATAQYAAPQLVLAPLLFLMQAQSIAVNRIERSYALNLFPTTCQLLTTLAAPSLQLGVHFVALSTSIGQALSVAYALHGLRLPTEETVALRSTLFAMARESVSVRMAHNIYSLGQLFLVSRYATVIPDAQGSILLTAKRIGDSVVAVLVGPAQRRVLSEFTGWLSNGAHESCRHALRTLDKRHAALFVTVTPLVAPLAILLSHQRSLPVSLVALTLFCQLTTTALIVIETPWAMVSAVYGKATTFARSNVAYVLTLAISTHIGLSLGWPAPLPVALAASQFIVFLNNRTSAAALLTVRHPLPR